MKFSLIFITSIILSTQCFASQLTNLKIDSVWRVKYDAKEWSYIYLKPSVGISSNIFEHRKEKIKIILQRETHVDNSLSSQNLVKEKCDESNKFYASNFSGSAQVMTINNKKVCYIEYKNVSGELAHQIVYPEPSKTRNYDLYSYAWNSSDRKSREVVVNFLKGFLR